MGFKRGEFIFKKCFIIYINFTYFIIKVYVTDNNYHSRWRDQYQDKLIMSVKRIEDLKKGDVYIYSEGMACVHNIPEGFFFFNFFSKYSISYLRF